MRNELDVGFGFVPENAAGVHWWFTRAYLLDDDVQLESLVSLQQLELGDGGVRSVAVEVTPHEEASYLIRPAATWSVGERYRLEVDVGEEAAARDASQRFAVVEFEIAQALESAPTLEFEVSDPQTGELRIESDGCWLDANLVYVDTSLTLPSLPDGLSNALLHYSTFVDGERWVLQERLCQAIEPGTSWIARARDRIVASCDDRYKLNRKVISLGKHSVRMEARLPETDVVFASEEVEIELSCPPAADSTSDDAPDAGVRQESRPEAGAQQGSSSDAGSSRLSEPRLEPSTHESASGGSCALAIPRPGSAAAPLLLLTLLALRRRERGQCCKPTRLGRPQE